MTRARRTPIGPQLAPGTRAAHRGITALAFAALGVVFGDIGTGPLCALRTVFTIDGGVVNASKEDVYGVISMTRSSRRRSPCCPRSRDCRPRRPRSGTW